MKRIESRLGRRASWSVAAVARVTAPVGCAPPRAGIGTPDLVAPHALRLALSVAAGVAAGFAAAAPTGRPGVDLVLRAVGVGLVVLVGSAAPAWAVTVAGGVGLLIAVDPGLMAAAAVAVGVGCWMGTARGWEQTWAAVSLALTLNVAIRAELGGPFGTSAAVVGAVVIVLTVAGLRRSSPRVRWWAGAAVVLVVVLTAVAAAGTVYAVLRARHQLSDGVRAAERGVAAFEHGDVEAAARWFRVSAADLTAAHDALSKPWTTPATVVPVLAQHRDAVVEMSAAGAEGAATAADVLGAIDLDALRIHGGRLDVAAVAALADPLARVRAALDDLGAATARARSPWLVGRADYELDDFETSIAAHVPSLDNAIHAVGLAPAMLGADGPRRYLVLVTTPTEARGLGGSIRAYAELTVSDGTFTLGPVGDPRDIDRRLAGGGPPREHEEFVARYGRFGFGPGGGGAVGAGAFADLTLTPHFPWVGEMAADLYQQATGRVVDGVIAADPMVLRELLRDTGPVRLAGGVDLNADNAVDFLLGGQYELSADSERPDALGDALSAIFAEVAQGALPDPIELADQLGGVVEQRRLLLWSARPAEQDLLEFLGAAGALPDPSGAHGEGFTVSNAGGGDIDRYLRRRASYEYSTDDGGTTTAALRIELTNAAPVRWLPDRVVANDVGLPPGTSRLYLSVYSTLGLDGAALDGAPLALDAGTERGWSVYSGFVEIPPGETVTVEVELSGVVESPDELVTWVQPGASRLRPID